MLYQWLEVMNVIIVILKRPLYSLIRCLALFINGTVDPGEFFRILLAEGVMQMQVDAMIRTTATLRAALNAERIRQGLLLPS